MEILTSRTEIDPHLRENVVPEIKNEIPSDSELAAYFDESLRESVFGMLGPEHFHHYHPELIEALQYFSSAHHFPDFLSTFRDSLFQSVQRLNQLARTGSFWTNTNLRPIVFKLGGFCDRILKDDPHDVLSLRTLTALTVFHGAEFGRSPWERLYREGAASVPSIFFAAMLLEIAGADSADEFAEFVKLTGTKSDMQPLFQDASQRSGKLLSRWSHRVTEALAA